MSTPCPCSDSSLGTRTGGPCPCTDGSSGIVTGTPCPCSCPHQGTVPVPCCPTVDLCCDPGGCGLIWLPTTLHASLSNQSNCPCVSGTITLTWDAANNWWRGTGAFGSCGRNVTLTFYCNGRSGPCAGNCVFNLDDHFSDACRTDLTCWAVSAVCGPPFVFTSTPSGSQSCGCNVGSSAYKVVITA